ncbi:MAG: cytochrome c1 [Betaproteobacteria bacterium]|nr:MAG: cytochrome c1 [Betaproteobacteria bacterium]
MRRLLLVCAFASALFAAWLAPAAAAEAGYRLDRSPHDPNDLVSLQSGARLFVNYCLNCHGAQFMRYNRLTDIGLSESQIRDNLMFPADKVGETMKVALGAKESKDWFGVPPPDLSVIARSRGADWLYTYLRTFYRDAKTSTGWNNAVFPNAAMPHALWKLQGERALEVAQVKDLAGHVAAEYRWSQLTPGTLGAVQYDTAVRDLVNFLVYVGEPSGQSRKRIGVIVLFVLGVLFVFAYALKKNYWKDLH